MLIVVACSEALYLEEINLLRLATPHKKSSQEDLFIAGVFRNGLTTPAASVRPALRFLVLSHRSI